jgi:hypothetical protein
VKDGDTHNSADTAISLVQRLTPAVTAISLVRRLTLLITSPTNAAAAAAAVAAAVVNVVFWQRYTLALSPDTTTITAKTVARLTIRTKTVALLTHTLIGLVDRRRRWCALQVGRRSSSTVAAAAVAAINTHARQIEISQRIGTSDRAAFTAITIGIVVVIINGYNRRRWQ